MSRNELLGDFVGLLDHCIEAHTGIWAYRGSGRPYLEELFDSPDYDGTREAAVIPDIGRDFAKTLPDRISIIEIGPGVNFKSKTGAFIDAVNAVKGPGTIVEYHALDRVADYAISSAQFMAQKYSIKGAHSIGSYTTHPRIQSDATPVVLSWNSPVWNEPIPYFMGPEFIYANNMRKIQHLAGPQAMMILTHFPITNPADTARIYQGENNRRAVLSIPSYMEEHLNPECHVLSPQGKKIKQIRFSKLFDFNAHIVKELANEFVSMDLISRYDAEVALKKCTKILTVGESFNVVRSAKPSVTNIEEIMRIADIKIAATRSYSSGSVIAHALQF